MKFKGLCIALLLLFVLGFNRTVSGSQIQPNTTGTLRIIASSTNLRRGDLGYITIQGKPSTSYNIHTTYQRGDRTVRVSQMRLTDANGRATFNWVVEDGTAVGTNTATITGGGETITTTHTVTE
jgi:hypothetical protein